MLEKNGAVFGLFVLLGMAAAIIVVFFWLVRRYVLPLMKRRRTYLFVDTWLLRTEVLAWFLFGSFAIYRLLLNTLPITLVFLVLFGAVGWTFWKDFFTGLLFRLERKIKVGDVISLSEITGAVRQIGVRNIQVEKEKGEMVIIPYRKLSAAFITKSHPKGNLVRNTFNIILKDTADGISARQQIKRLILESPWCVPSHPPVIEKNGVDGFQVTVFSTDKMASEKLERFVKDRATDYTD